MPTLVFGEYRPDVSDLDGQHTRTLSNVLPRGDGYGPVRAIAALTSALPAACRGYFVAKNTDGSVAVFAGTSTKLYRLNNTTFAWVDVSAGAGTYTTLNADAHWQFAQFANRVIATQGNDDVQSYVLGSSSEFADLGGSPPDAAYVAVVGQFVVLSGLTANPFRIHWCAIGDPTGWTAGTNQSDFQDLADGGIARLVLGGEFGIVFQDQALRRMTFAPGSDVIFQIERIANDIGLLHPYAATAVGDQIFFLSTKGFVQTNASGAWAPIGAERVDATFKRLYDPTAPQLVLCVADPRSNTVIWTYRTSGNTDAHFDAMLAYNWVLKKWVPIALTGECIAPLSQPGLTIEALDAIAPGALTITGAADNGSGLIRVEVADTSDMDDAVYRTISGMTGTVAANGTWLISIIDATHFDLIEDTAGVASVFDAVDVTGTADNGSGLIRLEVTSTANMTTGERRNVTGVGGTTEANDDWLITVIDGTHIDLQDSAFSNAWTSGGAVSDYYHTDSAGIVGGFADEMETSWDAIQDATLPNLSLADVSHKLGFLSGENIEATLETAEQSGDGQRILVNGFWPITDSATVHGKVGKRENLNANRTYTGEVTMNTFGFVPTIRSTRYATGLIRIPAGTTWTFATGVRPETQADGEA